MEVNLRTQPLESALFGIFANEHMNAYKLPEHFWAVTEAINRVRLSTNPLICWKVRKARKVHKCSRGCVIKPGEKYYLSRDGAKETRICVRCEARLWRDDLRWLYWEIRRANKDHECVRGCSIKSSEQYFKSDGSSVGLKMCARCMAMVLFFKNVDELKPCHYLGWDGRRSAPKRSLGHRHAPLEGMM